MNRSSEASIGVFVGKFTKDQEQILVARRDGLELFDLNLEKLKLCSIATIKIPFLVNAICINPLERESEMVLVTTEEGRMKLFAIHQEFELVCETLVSRKSYLDYRTSGLILAANQNQVAVSPYFGKIKLFTIQNEEGLHFSEPNLILLDKIVIQMLFCLELVVIGYSEHESQSFVLFWESNKTFYFDELILNAFSYKNKVYVVFETHVAEVDGMYMTFVDLLSGFCVCPEEFYLCSDEGKLYNSQGFVGKLDILDCKLLHLYSEDVDILLCWSDHSNWLLVQTTPFEHWNLTDCIGPVSDAVVYKNGYVILAEKGVYYAADEIPWVNDSTTLNSIQNLFTSNKYLCLSSIIYENKGELKKILEVANLLYFGPLKEKSVIITTTFVRILDENFKILKQLDGKILLGSSNEYVYVNFGELGHSCLKCLDENLKVIWEIDLDQVITCFAFEKNVCYIGLEKNTVSKIQNGKRMDFSICSVASSIAVLNEKIFIGTRDGQLLVDNKVLKNGAIIVKKIFENLWVQVDRKLFFGVDLKPCSVEFDFVQEYMGKIIISFDGKLSLGQLGVWPTLEKKLDSKYNRVIAYKSDVVMLSTSDSGTLVTVFENLEPACEVEIPQINTNCICVWNDVIILGGCFENVGVCVSLKINDTVQHSRNTGFGNRVTNVLGYKDSYIVTHENTLKLKTKKISMPSLITKISRRNNRVLIGTQTDSVILVDLESMQILLSDQVSRHIYDVIWESRILASDATGLIILFSDSLETLWQKQYFGQIILFDSFFVTTSGEMGTIEI